MKRLFLLFAVICCFCFSGCASYSQIMINAMGEWQRCASYGYGVMGIATADSIQNDCVKSLRAAGYIEIEKAGVIGTYLSDEDTPLIIKVKENSPAYIAGIKAGDKITKIDGQNVSNKRDARLLLFGMADTPVELTIDRDGVETSYKLIRASFTKVFGMPTETKTKAKEDSSDK
ncbi:MAG: PDZ domain-containing protein [Candidatus Brocadia sp.]|jgi:membrane-associated protease RseP (regulator of RpoE activity)